MYLLSADFFAEGGGVFLPRLQNGGGRGWFYSGTDDDTCEAEVIFEIVTLFAIFFR